VDWIEVSARTLDDARELALDRLGVVADELEYEVIDQPKGGLFGIGRTEARIRARVRPISREKPTDRRRRRSSERRPSGGGRKRNDSTARSSGNADATRPAANDETESADRPTGAPRAASSSSRRRRRGRGSGSGAGQGQGQGQGQSKGTAGGGADRPPRQRSNDRPETNVNMDTDTEDADVEGQAEHAAEFTKSLVEAMGLSGTVTSRVDDEDTVLVAVEGEGLGLLVGPRGSTLQAIEELVRAVVQHGLSGRSARLRVDVGGYKERRREALAAFAKQVAAEVLETQRERALEPMSAPDRKVVHDTAAEIDGVETSSEGEEPRRRVVISPA
jgi:spoIIIJ-associated protein